MKPARDQSEDFEVTAPTGYDFGLKRRAFVQVLGAGLLVAVSAAPALAQRRGGRGGAAGPRNIAARVHLGKDGAITVMTGKVEAGQGARAELSEAAAEELRVPVRRIQLIMADTELVPDDGTTAGSASTPRTVPAIRRGAAAAREALIDFAAKRWSVERGAVQVREGKASISGQKAVSYADLAADAEAAKALAREIPAEVTLTPVGEWSVLGKAASRPNGRDLVTGNHKYPSDISPPGLLYGKVLRPPSYGAKLISVDLAPAKAMRGVVAVKDEQFVGVAAPAGDLAEKALAAIAKTAKWELATHPSSKDLFEHLEKHASGGVPPNPFAEDLAQARQVVRQTYHVPHVQHAPLEPRAAVAEWAEGKLTVWTGTQNPFGCRSELARAFHLGEQQVRVIVPDFGSGFGGKHTGETGIEAARLARAANRPVSLRWTRQEEFTWAYFRPAAVIRIEAGLDDKGRIAAWHFININSGGSGIETPYRAAKHRSQFVRSADPLRQGSYRCLAATANHFARESFMDELAAAAGADPLAFRLAHLDNPRLRAVLETAAQRFGWQKRFQQKNARLGVGLACGTEKGSYVAACVEAELDLKERKIAVRRVCQVFDCGAILNPANLLAQVQGAIIMGLGPALHEEITFENGQVSNSSFRRYQVPRFSDVPELDIHLLNRPELDSAGGGETPIVAIAPAVGNAVFHATGLRLRAMPLRLPGPS